MMAPHKLLSYLAALFFSVIIFIAAIKLPSLEFDSDILALFPQEPVSGLHNAKAKKLAESKVSKFVSDRLFLLVSASTFADAYDSASRVSAAFTSNDAIESVQLEQDPESLQSLFDLYRQYSPNFLTSQNLSLINDSPDKFIKDKLRSIYQSPSSIGSESFIIDPFGTAESFIQGVQSLQTSRLQFDEGVLYVEDDGRFYVLVQVMLAQSAFSITVQNEVVELLGQIHDDFASNLDVQILNNGALFFAASGADQAKSEISTVGLGSLLGIILLLILVFRSGSILLLSTVPIALGVLTGVVVCQSIFGSIHIIAMVFGASLVGVSIDYTFHFLTCRLSMSNDGEWSSKKGVSRLFNGLTLGLLTSASAYASFIFSGFPGFQQIALFSSVGLLAAYLAVIGLFPIVLSRPHSGLSHQKLFALGDRFLKGYLFVIKQRAMVPIVVCLMVFIGYGFFSIKGDDDVRSMQSMDSSLIQKSQRFQALTGQKTAHQFFLISANTQEGMLIRSERLISQLSDLSVESRALSQWLPSVNQQKVNQESFLESIVHSNRLSDFLNALGVKDDVKDTIIADQNQRLGHYLTMSHAYSSIDSVVKFPSYFELNGQYHSLVLLGEIKSTAPLVELAAGLEGVMWVDRVVDTNALLYKFRSESSQLLLFAYAGILLLLSLRYGLVGAVQVLIPPLLASGVTVALLALFSMSINVFNVMALLLVLGIGIDYSLFLRESRSTANETLFAISLSAMTTLLSFGLLALSETQAIRSFGITILFGISCCFIFAPIVVWPIQRPKWFTLFV